MLYIKCATCSEFIINVTSYVAMGSKSVNITLEYNEFGTWKC